MSKNKNFTRVYSEDKLNNIAFPMGGIGAGMICLEGSGALSQISIQNRPDVFNEPNIFSAISVKYKGHSIAKVLEGAVPGRKVYGGQNMAEGGPGRNIGLPRFSNAEFSWNFPFAHIRLNDSELPLDVTITGWSPFIPNDSDNSSLPFAGLEFKFKNTSSETLDFQYSFNAINFLSPNVNNKTLNIRKTKNSFIFHQEPLKETPWLAGEFSARINEENTLVDCQWFRGGWFDSLTILWKQIIAQGINNRNPYNDNNKESPGASLGVDFILKPNEEKIIPLALNWYFPKSNLRELRIEDAGEERDDEHLISETKKECYEPWYSGKFKNVEEVSEYVRANYCVLRDKSQKFSDCFYDSTLPNEVLEAISANLAILKSPTVLRQKDGRFWAWEGCYDDAGSCAGTCIHVWNYAQALPHLFSDLERTIRETEFFESQDKKGHQNYRTALPIAPGIHNFHPAADGQLGGIMKVYRDWRINGDDQWLKKISPKLKSSLDYCIETWDPNHSGALLEPHHNTYDIQFWGADGMCTSFYLGALKAAIEMFEYCKENTTFYKSLFEKGCRYIDEKLYNGEFYIQNIQWKGLKAKNPLTIKSVGINYSPEAEELLQKEGPKYQYGYGCLSDGIIGAWIAKVCGIGSFLDKKKEKSHLCAVYKYNLRYDLSNHPNPQRAGYALGKEGGLLLCTWPNGGELTLPFVYSNEVWTGIEYQVASHLAMNNEVSKALDIVKEARKRYDGKTRNPFDEFESGHWYARAMASYGLLQGITGIRYDAVSKTLEIKPNIEGDFRSFLSTATGYGTVGVKNNRPFIEVVDGEINIENIDFTSYIST